MLIAMTAASMAVAGVGISTAAARPGPAATREAAAASWSSDKGVIVRDITIKVPHQDPVSAYLVKPAGNLRRDSSAGVLWLHWLGQIHNDRTEYLGEAIGLAGSGVVSVLPQGYFPWVPNPDGTTGDVALVKDQVAAYRAALGRLVNTRGVDASRVALVGHDYGAMYGSILAQRDHRVKAMVLQAPDSLMGNWFAQFWLGLEGQARDDYLALFHGLDPVDNTSRLGSHVLFQWAGQDVYIPEEVRDAFAAANPDAQVALYPNADHFMTDAALIDRDAFLADQLGLTP